VVLELMDDVWENKKEVVIEHWNDITMPMALYVIGAAGEFIPTAHTFTLSSMVRFWPENDMEGFGHSNWAPNDLQRSDERGLIRSNFEIARPPLGAWIHETAEKDPTGL
jgi:hypothetical protein